MLIDYAINICILQSKKMSNLFYPLNHDMVLIIFFNGSLIVKRVIIIIACIFICITHSIVAIEINTDVLPDKTEILFPARYHYRQTYNDCGPYSIKAVLTIIKEKEPSITEIKKNLKWRMKNNYSIPWGIEGLIKKHGITIKTPNAKKFTDKKKIILLKQHLAAQSPIIILIGTEKGYQHYITILGYDKTHFYIYDSALGKSKTNGMFTTDLNGKTTGNNSLTYEKLLRLWKAGGMYGFYQYYLLITLNPV